MEKANTVKSALVPRRCSQANPFEHIYYNLKIIFLIFFLYKKPNPLSRPKDSNVRALDVEKSMVLRLPDACPGTSPKYGAIPYLELPKTSLSSLHMYHPPHET